MDGIPDRPSGMSNGGFDMKRTVAVAACFAAIATVTTPALAQEGQVIRMGDSALTCANIVMEANAAAETLGGTPEGGLMTGEAAVGLAQTAAVHTGMASAVPGLGAVGGLFRKASEARKQKEEEEKALAQSRWYYLNGLYSGRQCDQVLAAEAASSAAPEAATEAATEVSAQEG